MKIVISEACSGFWSCLSPDAWLTAIGTLVGAFLGAALAGGAAIYVLRKQLSYDQYNRNKLEIGSILRESGSFSQYLIGYLTICKNFEKEISESDEVITNSTLYKIMGFHNTTENIIEDLNSVDLRVIPYEKHKMYSDVIKRIMASNIAVGMMLSTLNIKREKSKILDSFAKVQENRKALDEVCKEIKEFTDKQEEIINKFEKKKI